MRVGSAIFGARDSSRWDLLVDEMARTIAFSIKIAPVMRVGGACQRHALTHSDPGVIKLRDFVGIVGDQPHLMYPNSRRILLAGRNSLSSDWNSA